MGKSSPNLTDCGAAQKQAKERLNQGKIRATRSERTERSRADALAQSLQPVAVITINDETQKMSPVAKERDAKGVRGWRPDLQPVASVLVRVLEAGQTVLSNGCSQQRECIYKEENIQVKNSLNHYWINT